ncbi:MAG: PAS domain S-box protein [Desulfocapsaceae bacterium]
MANENIKQKQSVKINTDLNHDELDLGAILKSSLEIGGAQHGYLILEENGQWVVIAKAEIDADPEIRRPVSLETITKVSTRIVEHVACTKEPMALSDAANEGPFVDDATIKQNQSKSIFCIPLLYRDRVNGIVYIENNNEIGAFTPDRVKLVNLFLSQTALVLENVQLHATLTRSEARFRATFEQAAVGIANVAAVGPVGRFLQINKKFCDIVGYTREEMLNLTFQDITHPDDLDTDLEHVRKLLEGDIATYSMEKRYYRKDSSTVWVNLTVSLLRDKEGNPDHFVSVAMDITDRKQAEKDLIKSRDFLAHLTSAVPDLILSIKMPERTIFWANDSFNVLGYDPEEYIGQSTEKYYANSEDFNRVGLIQQEAIRNGDNMIRVEVMALHNDGREIPVEMTASYYREGGKISRITAMARDITVRKQAEAKLIESEGRYRSLVDNSMVGVFHSTVDGRFIFVNQAMAEMFDFDNPKQMVAQGPNTLWRRPKERGRLLDELLEHETVANFETEAVTQTYRHLHVLFSARLIGNDIFGMIMDITERKEAEQKIIDSQQRLKSLASQLTLVEEKERRLIAVGLHDHVGQSLALARMQIASASATTTDAHMKGQLNDISKTLLRILDDTQMLMLELSAPTIHEAGLSAVISDWLASHVEAKHDLVCNVTDDVDNNLRKSLDPNVRSILFRNVRELVVNVVKHARATMVNVRLNNREKKLHIIIEDDGIGFSLQEIKGADRQSGGFGLFSIEELMSDLGGSIIIESEPGKGCTAILSAPIGITIGEERGSRGS